MPNTQKTTQTLSRAEVQKAWWKAARPAFYIATLIPLFLGFIIAGKEYGVWRPAFFCVILLASFCLHLAANLANDLFDFLLGTDTEGTIGGSGAIQSGAISIETYQKTLHILFGISAILGIFGAVYTGFIGIIFIILFAIFSSYFYVAPPVRYGYRALGEVFVFLNMGITMVVGCTYALSGEISLQAFAISIPVGLMVAGILYFQSLPEIETDLSAGKHTLANTLGAEKALQALRIWWPTIWVLMLCLWLAEFCSWIVFIGIGASIPLYLRACKRAEEAASTNQWLLLDAHGHLVRKMYLLCGLSLIAGILIR